MVQGRGDAEFGGELFDVFFLSLVLATGSELLGIIMSKRE